VHQGKIRLAVPYNERLLGHPNQGYRTLLEALGSAHDPAFDIFNCHESQLLADDSYDAVFSILSGGTSFLHLDWYRKTNKLLAIWQDDLHRYLWHHDEMLELLFARIDCADVIFLPYFRQFLTHKIYKPYFNKAVSLPWSVPDWMFGIATPWNERKDQALISGMVARQYPFRRKIKRYIEKSKDPLFTVLEHPSYQIGDPKHGIIGRAFYEELARHKGGIVTSAKKPINYTVAKYVEVPACGCLAFMEKTPDLRDMGFVDGENYIHITNWNFKSKIKLLRSDEACTIAQAGRELIKRAHTHSQRIKIILFEIQKRMRLENSTVGHSI
jgi:hypothetical protein